MTQNTAPAATSTAALGDWTATWVMPNGARTSGTFLDTTPARVHAAVAAARGTRLTLARLADTAQA